jgi:hypothetical protein
VAAADVSRDPDCRLETHPFTVLAA